MRHNALWACTHIPNIIYLSRKKQLGHYGTWHTALWSYTHIPNIIDLSQDKNTMVQTRKYYLKKHYLTLRSKSQEGHYDTRHTSYGHAPIPNIIDLSQKKIIWPQGQRSRSNKGYYGMRHTALWLCTHIPNIIDLSRKKQLFDIEVKGQGPTKVITVCDTPPYGHASTYQISFTYLERNN
jgi:hypothetical protein